MISVSYGLGNHSARFGDTGLSIEAHLTAVAQAGFSLVGIDDWTVGAWLERRPLGRLGNLLHHLGLGCSDVGPLRITAEADAVDATRWIVDVANALGAWLIPVVVLDDRPGQAVRALSASAAVAADAGIQLAVEFIKWSAVPDLHAAARLVDDIDRPNVGLLLDTFQLALGGDDMSVVDDLSLARLALVQLADAPDTPPIDARDASSHGRLLPGTGSLPLRHLRHRLATAGWDGVVSLEVLSRELRVRDTAVVALEARRAVDQWLEASSPAG